MVSIPMETQIPQKNFTRWNLAKLKNPSVQALMVEKFQNIDLTFIKQSNDVEEIYQFITDKINSLLKDSIGYYHYKNKINCKFWNSDLLKLQEEFFESKRIFINARSNFTRTLFRTNMESIKVKLDNAIRKRHVELFRKFTEDCEYDDIGLPVKIMKNLFKKQSQTYGGLDKSKINDYGSFYETTFGANPSGNPNIYDHIALNNTLPENNINTNLNCIPWSKNEVLKWLKNIPSKKASGIDNIPGDVLKILAEPISIILKHLFDQMWINNYIPSKLCSAIIHPIFKKGDIIDIANYRPISLTSQIRRIYEKLIYSKFGSRINNIINPIQGGFLPKRGTLHQIQVLDSIIKNNPNINICFIDIQQAYDSVDRNILWSKLYEYLIYNDNSNNSNNLDNLDNLGNFGNPNNRLDNIKLIQVLRSLFDYNYSYLRIQDALSNPIYNSRGVIQGSTLSPLLFNVFFNSIIEKIQNVTSDLHKSNLNTLAYADDACLMANDPNQLQSLINIANEWCNENGLKLSLTKSEVIGDPDHTFYIDDHPLKNVPTFKYLGVYFDRFGINGNINADKIIEKSTKVLNFLKSKGINRKGFGLKVSMVLIKTFILSHLNYGFVMTILSNEVHKKLKKWYNQAIRSITGGNFNTSINAMLILSNQTPFDIRLEELQGRYLYGIHKLVEENVEAPICDLYKANINDEDHDDNLEHDFIYQTKKKNVFFKTFINPNFNEISMVKKIRKCRIQRF
jgi:hypothetical protein